MGLVHELAISRRMLWARMPDADSGMRCKYLPLFNSFIVFPRARLFLPCRALHANHIDLPLQ